MQSFINMIFELVTPTILLINVSVLSLHWVFALCEIYQKNVKRVTEQLSFILVIGLAFLFLIVLITLGTLIQLHGKSSTSDIALSYRDAYSALLITLIFLNLVACFALLTLSFVGFLNMRKISHLGRDKQFGVLKLIALALIIFLAQLLYTINFALQMQMLTPRILIIPEWFNMLIVRCLALALQTACILALIVGGARSKRSSQSIKRFSQTEMSSMEKPLLETKTSQAIKSRYEV